MPISLPPFGLPWAMLDRDTKHSGHSNATGPEDPSVLGAPWPYKSGGPIFSSPAIDYSGTAYIGSEDGWIHAVGFNGQGAPLFKTGGPIQASPALIEDIPLEGQSVAPPVIYFGSDDGQIYSILPNGALRWSLLPPTPSPVRSSPVVAPLGGPLKLNRVYVGSDNGKLYAIFETSSTSAVTVWEITTAAPLRTSPALSPLGDRVYVGASDGRLHCLDAFNGIPLAGTPVNIGGGSLTTPAVDSAGNVYVGNASGTLFAFDPVGGAIWQVPLGTSISAPPTIGMSGEVLVIADDILYALSAAGVVLWNQAFPNVLDAAAPVVDSAGTAYVASTDGWVFGVKRYPVAAGSRVLWSVQVDPRGPKLTTPALDAYGRVYVGALDSRLYVIDEIPAFQIAFHSDLSASPNVDVHSLRETYGVVDPARTLRLTDDPALDQQPAYSLDRSVMAYVSDRAGSQDAFLATAIATDEENLTGAGSPFPPNSIQANPAFTPIDDLTGFPRPPHLKSYMGLTSNDTGLDRLVFIDLEAQASGSILPQSFTNWAMSMGVPNAITVLLEPPNTEQSQIAFSPDGMKIAWRHSFSGIGQVMLLSLIGSIWSIGPVGPAATEPEGVPFGDEPCFSPDSRWLAIRQGNSLTIYGLTSPFSTYSTTPKSPVGMPTHPSWAPDGSEIAVGLNTGTYVDLFIASGKGYGTFSRLTSSRTSNEPYYHYFKMPPPQALRMNPDRQFPGTTIEILGRGFDILHPENNTVSFTDTQRGPLREAQVLSATVNPKEGLGVLTVRVPDFAGHGPITVKTRFGSSTTPDFYVLPNPTSIVKPRSVPGAKVRVFGLGFDLSPATQNRVSFTAAAGGFVTASTISGGLDGIKEFLIVLVPSGIAETGPIRVDNVFGGSVCDCTFIQLHPKFSISRTVDTGLTTGLPEYALQGSAGVMVRLEGVDFPFDPYFGFGTGSASIDIETLVQAIPPIPIGIFPFVKDAGPDPDTAKLGPVTFLFPNLPQLVPGHPGGDLRVHASDANWQPINAAGPFRIPLMNIPIIFIPGTSGTSLDIESGTLLPVTNDQQDHWHGAFPFQHHSFRTFTYSPAAVPGNDPRGPRVWLGPEATRTILDPINIANYNVGNHYLDAVGFDSVGAPLHPEIVPGTVIYDLTVDIPSTGFRGSWDFYKPLIDFLTRPNPLDPLGWPGRPLCNGLNPILPTTGAETCFDVSGGVTGAAQSGDNAVYLFNLDWRNSIPNEAQRLSDFIDIVLARPDVTAKKVVLITHSYGGPVARWYYLDPDNHPNRHEQKVDQMISFGGGFNGVPLPFKILEMGDSWGFGFTGGPISFGLADWQLQALAQNWPTSYYQLPNSELWFWDHGTFLTGVTSSTVNKINRAFIRDFRTRLSIGFTGPGEITTYAKSMDWIGLSSDTILGRPRHNTGLTAEVVTQFRPRTGFISLGDFRIGTGPIYHHRIIGKGSTDTIVGAALYTNRITYGTPPVTLEYDYEVPITGDGDHTVSYWGALGLTEARDDRVYILDKVKHLDLTLVPEMLGKPVGGGTPQIIKGLLQMLLEGSICSQPQVASILPFLSQNQVTEIV
jgi:outer membrane protein assembly factor BamB